MSYDPVYVEFQVKIITQTEKAALIVRQGAYGKFWVPWSQIEDNGEDHKSGYEGSMWINEWWVKKEGM